MTLPQDTGRVVASYVPATRRFQQTFGPYFPWLLTDFEGAASEMGWLSNRVFLNPMYTVRRPKAHTELAETVTALNRMATHEDGHILALWTRLYHAASDGDEAAERAREVAEFLMLIREWAEENVLRETLDVFRSTAAGAIDETPDQRNVKWDAVHAIDKLRILWWRNTGRWPAGRRLNPASKFAGFLRDGFTWLEIEAEPLSAFRRWATTRQGVTD